jgi:hypothetical protein
VAYEVTMPLKLRKEVKLPKAQRETLFDMIKFLSHTDEELPRNEPWIRGFTRCKERILHLLYEEIEVEDK